MKYIEKFSTLFFYMERIMCIRVDYFWRVWRNSSKAGLTKRKVKAPLFMTSLGTGNIRVECSDVN